MNDSITTLSPEAIASQIHRAEVNSSAYSGIKIIEIHCSLRNRHTTAEEKQLLTDNGYVELYNVLIVGWDMWGKPEDFPGITLPMDI